jgi:shikimate dehydrogenase
MPRSFLSLLTGSFATPAAENPTVAMIEAAYRHHGLDARYMNCEVAPEGLGDAVRGAWAMGWAGFNCSLPHKVAVIELLDRLAPSAEVIGAVNTVVATDGRLVGHNTDGQGFVESLRTVVDPAGLDLVVLGAGGAARAVAVETALAGASSVTVVNRDRRRGEELARVVTAGTGVPATYVAWDQTYAVPDGADVLVNATSVGLGDGDALVDVSLDTLRAGLVVADVVVSPPRTALLRAAEERGARTLDGLGMLVGQGALAVRHWTGIEPDRAVMRAAAASALGLE